MYQIVNKSGNAASLENNPSALFEKLKDAEKSKKYLINDCCLDENDVEIKPFFNLSTVWDFVEKYYPKYSTCEQIAYNNDLKKIISSEWEEGDSAHKIYLEIQAELQDFIKSSDMFDAAKDKDIIRVAESLICVSNESIYHRAIDNFIQQTK